MNFWDYFLLALITAAVCIATAVILRRRKSGKSCCGDCSSCSGCSVRRS